MKKFEIVQKKWKKVLAIILSVCALVGNFVVITVGLNLNFVREVYRKVTNKAYSKVTTVEDIVCVNATTNIPMNTSYPLSIYPSNTITSYAKLIFESLTPEVFSLPNGNKSSFVKSAVFDDDEVHTGILRVTSETDSKFKKDLELTFKKRYDDTFKPVINRMGGKLSDGSYRVYEGVSFYFAYQWKTNTTQKELTFEYDEEFFDHPNINCFTPKKSGTTTITIKYYDRASWTFNLSVASPTRTSVNDFKIYRYPSTTSALTSDTLINGLSYYVFPVEDTTKRFVPYTITSSNSSILSISSNNILYPKKPGVVTITLTVGEEILTKQVSVEDEFVITLPNLKSKYQDPDDDKKINIFYNTTCSPSVVYNTIRASHDVTLVYDHDFMSATYKGSGATGYLTIKAKEQGESPITLIYGEGGDNQKEITFMVNTEQTYASGNAAKIIQYYKKGFSHVAVFFILGMATLLFGLYVISKWPFGVKLASVLGFGLFFGALEELIQVFIPGRNSSWKDILFYDWLSYLIGVAFMTTCILIYLVIKNMSKNRRNNKQIPSDNIE